MGRSVQRASHSTSSFGKIPVDRARAARIESLRQTAAWDDLTAEIREAEDRLWKQHIADIKGGLPLDQRKLDFMRGALHAANLLLKQPEKADRVLKRDDEPDNEKEQ